MNSRLAAVLVVLLVWAVIYLPALGSIAIKGEEGRRILPAIGMLQTGNYIVPEVGGNPYFRKPPLVNWLVAASFRIFGVRNEWTARLPSAVVVLAVAVAFVTVARTSLGPGGSIVAALIWMTNIGMMEKGRLIEIEALYVSLCGLAIIFWLSFFVQRKSPWLIWVPAFIFLGLGLLAKGPTHLIFFYAIVFAVAWHMKEWRLLIHPAHFAGLAIMLGNFCGVGYSVLAQHPDAGGGSEMVESVHRPAPRLRFQVRQLDSKYPARSYLFFALGSFVPFRQVFKVSRSL